GKEKLVNRDISRESRSKTRSGKQKDRRSEQGRTAALIMAAVTRPPPMQGSSFVTEDQKGQEKKEKGGKTKDAGAKRGMRDVNAYSERFSGSRTPCEETCIIIGELVTLFWQY
ncbi:hypothetical protein KI387_014034, partial [Taxus chinensis]